MWVSKPLWESTQRELIAKDALIARLLDQQTDMSDRLMELIGHTHSYQLRSLATPASYTPVENRPYVSEEQSDLEYMNDHGMIDDAELRKALAELGFQNTELEAVGTYNDEEYEAL